MEDRLQGKELESLERYKERRRKRIEDSISKFESGTASNINGNNVYYVG